MPEAGFSSATSSSSSGSSSALAAARSSSSSGVVAEVAMVAPGIRSATKRTSSGSTRLSGTFGSAWLPLSLIAGMLLLMTIGRVAAYIERHERSAPAASAARTGE